MIGFVVSPTCSSPHPQRPLRFNCDLVVQHGLRVAQHLGATCARSVPVLRVFALAALLALSACGTGPVHDAGRPRGDFGTSEEPHQEDPDALSVQEAYMVGDALYLRYKIAGHDSLGKVMLGGESSTTIASWRTSSFAASVGVEARLSRLEDLSPESWAAHSGRGRKVAVSDASRWRTTLRDLYRSISPAQPGYGAVVDVLGVYDMFVYYDRFGALRTVPLEYKPPEISVQSSYRLEELLHPAMSGLARIFDTHAAPASALLLDTGDADAGSYAFVFIDVTKNEIVFVRPNPSSDKRSGRLSPKLLTEATLHLTTSQLRGVIEQPFTSLARVLTLARSTTLDLIDPRGLLPPPAGDLPPAGLKPGMDLEVWERELDRLLRSKSVRGKIRFLIDGEEFFPRFIDVLSRANQSVHLRIYIFDNDDVALRIADLLKRRSAKIEVKVLVDGLGTIFGAAAHPDSPQAGQSVSGSVLSYLTRDSGIELRVMANPLFFGDHTKVIIVDDRTAFLGGMNIGREYRYEWHDLMLEVTGPVVDNLRGRFHKAWAEQGLLGDVRRFLTRVKPVNVEADESDYPIRVLETSPRRQQILKAQIAAIRRAQQRIFIQNAYFTSDAILYELALARRRGVDVRVILPFQSDAGLIDRSNATAANTMLANGIRVFIYPGMSHIKGAVYDGWACMGSANFDSLSLRVNREANLATSHAPAVQAFVDRVFLADMAKSVELTEPFPRRWSDFLVELLADRM